MGRISRIYNWAKREKNLYTLLGFWFLFLQVIVFIENHYVYKYNIFFWFCDHAPLLFSFAFFSKNKDFIKAMVNFGFLVQFVWVIDLVFKLFFDVHALRVIGYMFENELGFFVLVPLAIHMLSTNIAFLSTYKRKPNAKVLIYSAMYVMIIFALTITYTPIDRNVNCVHEICGLRQYTFPSYTYFWPILVFSLMVLPTHGIQYLIYKYSKRKRRN